MKKEITKRFPRPMGLTALVNQYYKTKDPQDLEKAQNYLLQHWIMGNGTICSISYDTNAINAMGIDYQYIRVYMRDRVLNSSLLDFGKQEHILESLLGEQLMWALEDRMDISNQVTILKKAQGNNYKPFVTAELTKAIKTKMDSAVNLQQLVMRLTGGSNNTNIFAQFNQINGESVKRDYVTLEEAQQLVIESNKVENHPEDVKLLETKYDILALPDVVATHQQGAFKREGATSYMNETEVTNIIDDYTTANKQAPALQHEIRREIENNIDPNDEDPELVPYEEVPNDPNHLLDDKEEDPFTNDWLN